MELKMIEKNTQIIVLSRNYSTGLGVIRSLGMAGYNLDLIASVKKSGSSKICSSSKYVNHAVEIKAPDIRLDDGEAIVMELLSYPYNRDNIILFPADDYTTSIIENYRHVLSDRFIMPRSDKYSLIRLMDKTFQRKMAEEVGLHVPEEKHIDLRREIEIPQGIKYPVFVKPMDSVSGHKNEMAVVENEEALLAHLQKMQATFWNRVVVVQEYLNIKKEYDFSGICLGDKVIIPGILEKINIAQHERGVTMAGKMHAVSDIAVFKREIQKIVDLLGSFNYYGMFDMEMNLVGRTLYFGEVNFRSGGPNFAYTLSGVNLPSMLAKALKGEDFEITDINEFGKTYVYEKVAWEDYIHGYLTKEEMQEIIDGADFKLLENPHDPKPGAIFNRKIRMSAMKHKPINALKKK